MNPSPLFLPCIHLHPISYFVSRRSSLLYNLNQTHSKLNTVEATEVDLPLYCSKLSFVYYRKLYLFSVIETQSVYMLCKAQIQTVSKWRFIVHLFLGNNPNYFLEGVDSLWFDVPMHPTFQFPSATRAIRILLMMSRAQNIFHGIKNEERSGERMQINCLLGLLLAIVANPPHLLLHVLSVYC